MKALVTGGAGYIGSHLVDRLLKEGWEVTVVDNLFTGRLENIDHNLPLSPFTFVKGDVRDRSLMSRLIEDSDLVCHLAAVVGVRHVLDNPVRSILDNALGTEVVLTTSRRFGRRVLFASTSEIYGKNPKLPFGEADDSVFGSTKVFRWSYGLAKALGEHLCFAYHSEGLPVSVVRYVNSYGPRLDPRGYGSVVAKFISQAMRGEALTVHGDGRQTRCFTYVDDTVAGSFMAATKDDALGEVFNVGSSVSSTVIDLAQLITGLTRSPSKITFVPYAQAYGNSFEDMTRELDSSKAEKILGFRAKVSLREGLEQTIAWFKTRQ
jgi:UDP-glucose 4-epimerase